MPAWVHRPRRLSPALLLAVAFVATVTGVIAAVRLLAGPGVEAAANGVGLGPPCPPNLQCDALFPPSASSVPSDPATRGSGSDGGGGGGAGTDAGGGPPSGEPPPVVPSPRVSRTGPSAKPTRTPTRTSTRTPTPTRTPTTAPTKDGGADTPKADDRPPTSAPPTTPPEVAKPVNRPRRAVVKFTVTRVVNGRYSAEIAIGNEGRGDLTGWVISVPIGGRAFAVDGARATQRGDVLVLSSRDFIPSGGGVAVTVAVQGRPIAPDFCELRGGRCRVL